MSGRDLNYLYEMMIPEEILYTTNYISADQESAYVWT